MDLRCQNDNIQKLKTTYNLNNQYMGKKTVLSLEGLEELQGEMKYLKGEKRIEVAEKLKEAISFGDLSENSEYEDARNEQAQIELRIAELDEILKNYELIDDKKSKRNRGIAIGHSITIENTAGEEITYKIVGPTETDIFENKISNESPLGLALLGKEVGEFARGKSHAGEFSYKIIKIA